MFRSSVTKLIMTLQGLIGFVLVAISLYVAASAVNDWRSAERAAALAHVDKILFDGTVAVRNLVAPAQTALQSEDDPRATVDRLRKATAEKFAISRAALAAAAVDGHDKLLGGVDATWKELAANDGAFDVEMGKPRAERDLHRTDGWRTAAYKVVDSLSAASAVVSNEVRMTDPAIAEMVQLRRAAWRVRDGYGAQCAMLRSEIPKNQKIDAATLAKWQVGRGNYMGAWSVSDELVARQAMPAAILDAVKTARGATDGAQTRIDQVVAGLGDEGKAVMSAKDWMGLCTGPFDSVVALAYGALENAIASADAMRVTAQKETAFAVVTALLAVVCIFYGFVAIRRRFDRPIRQLMGAIGRLAARELEVPVDKTAHGDELGAMADALESLRRSALEAARLEEAAAARREADAARGRALQSLCGQFETVSGNALSSIETSAQSLDATARDVLGLAAQSSERADQVSDTARQAAANVEIVAAATEELSASIGEISMRVSSSADGARTAVEQAKHTQTTVDALSAAAEQIGAVVQSINDIASQTNMLALNATIEAARAGEAGKGFAVVASEVKGLAQQTARATEDISRYVGQIQATTVDAVTAIRAIGTTIASISESVAAISAAVEQQGAATREIASNVQKAAHGTSDMSDTVAAMADLSHRTGTAAEAVSTSVEAVVRQQGALKDAVQGFLQDVKVV